MFECMSLLSHFSRVRLSATPWTTARQAPRSMGFSRQEHWSGLSVPSPVIKYEVSEVRSLSRVRLFTTLWTVAYQALPSMGFSRQEYWSGLPLPSPMDVLTRNKVTNKQSAAGQASAFHWDFNFCLSWKKLKVTQVSKHVTDALQDNSFQMGYFLVCWVGVYEFNVAPRTEKYKGIRSLTNTLHLNNYNYTKGAHYI